MVSLTLWLGAFLNDGMGWWTNIAAHINENELLWGQNISLSFPILTHLNDLDENLCKMGPSGNMWVTTIFPFPFKQTSNGTLATQSSYTQEIHLKVDTFLQLQSEIQLPHAKIPSQNPHLTWDVLQCTEWIGELDPQIPKIVVIDKNCRQAFHYFGQQSKFRQEFRYFCNQSIL